MTTHLDIDLDTATAGVTTTMPAVEIGVPGPQGPPGASGGPASGVTLEPYGNIAATNVQDAVEELDDEKPTYSYVDSRGVYVSPTPPADPTQYALWVDSS